MTNRDVAEVLEQIANILQIKDENPFKIRAYRKAAGTVYNLETDINEIYAQKRLGDIPGVGKGVKAIIKELLETGQCEYHRELLEEYPPGVFDLLALPGVGHTTVRTIYDHLGVTNLDDLLEAATDKRIRSLPGLGLKMEQNIIQGIEMLRQNAGKVTLGIAYPIAEHLREYLLSLDEVENAAITGSTRRWKPLVGDIDLLVAARQPEKVLRTIADYREIKRISLKEEDHIQGWLNDNIEFEIILVAPEDFYARLVWTTGSKAHREVLARVYGFNPEVHTAARSEAEVYENLNLPYIPPELRENTGELEAAQAGRLPQLVREEDIRGDLHVHSDWSDGAHKINDIVKFARAKGYSYIAITDHSKALAITGGLNEERLHAQARVIDEINASLKGFRILKGIEVDILRDGSLDLPDEVLEKLDLVVASIHSNFKLDREQQTHRIIQAIRNPQVKIIGHLTGRLLNRRSGYDIDVDRILEEAAQHHVALEINSHPDRLDIDEYTARKACQCGVKLAINSDTHEQKELSFIRYGVANARRGWITKDDVLNTLDTNQLLQYLKITP